jgi:hypothetical protein
MRKIGWLAGFCFSMVLVIIPALTSCFVLMLHHLLWWEIIGRLGPDFPEWAFWWGVAILGIKTYLALLGGALTSNVIAPRDYSRNWIKVAYLFVSGAAFYAVVFWQWGLGETPKFHSTYWLGWFSFGMWGHQLELYWEKYADDEQARESGQRKWKDPRDWFPGRDDPMPKYPRWIGVREGECNPNYELWQGFRAALFAVAGKFIRDEEKPKPRKPLGDAHVASVDETFKAGL